MKAYQALLTTSPTTHHNQPLFQLPDTHGANKPVTKRHLSKAFNALVQRIGFLAHTFTLHDLRRSGASAAYKAGITFTHIKRHGTWQSDAFWQYITPSAAAASPVPAAMAAAVQRPQLTLFKL